jgi:peptidoglycan hydrolase-like protein with peptidoglycan-binding domain
MGYQMINDKAGATKQVQEILRDRAYYLTGNTLIPVDGIYGDSTRDAVRQFQSDFGLPVDGVVGHRTWYLLQGEKFVLNDFLDPTIVSQIYPPIYEYESANGSEDSYIRIIQIMLNELGVHYDASDGLRISGVYDDATRRAVMEFQEKNGLKPDGRLTLPTRRRIAEDYEALLNDSK